MIAQTQRRDVLPRHLIPHLASRDRLWVLTHQDVFRTASQAIKDWSVSQQRQAEACGISTIGGNLMGGVDPGVEHVDVTVGDEHLFNISAARFRRCNDVNMKMTGQLVGGAVFLKMLEQGLFWEMKMYKGSDDIARFAGFSFQCGMLQ